MDNIIVFRSGKFFLLLGTEEIEVENPEEHFKKDRDGDWIVKVGNQYTEIQENEPIKWEYGYEKV